VAEARARVRRGEASPLEYFMKFRQMDVGLLAGNVGMFKWRVKRHLKPAKFRKLKPALLARYAECLDVSPVELRDFTGV
jgi:hypothetical protein